MLKLYDLCGKNNIRFSPPCWTIKLCLMYKDISFETIPVGFSEKYKIAFTNQNLVPILKSNDHFVCDSWDIINWLEQNYSQNPLFLNSSNKTFSYFLYHWTSKELLPVLFKIIANEIPKILDGKDLEYFVKTREEKIKGPLSKLKPLAPAATINFRKLVNPIRKIIKENNYISGKKPGLEDFIFFGNLKWIQSCNNYPLLEDDDLIKKWFSEIHKIFNFNYDL
jgi:glutathione S-transferase